MKARDNPYRSEQVLKIRYRFQDSSLPQILSRLQQFNYRAALVGPEGSGKTTLLEDLEKPLAALGKKIHWLRLTREFPRLSRAQKLRLRSGFTEDDVLLFDGAETLGYLRFGVLQWKLRRAGGLIVTTHRPGYLPTLLQTRTSPELLAEIFGELDPQRSSTEAPNLFRKHQGNIREALRESYDECMHKSPGTPPG